MPQLFSRHAFLACLLGALAPLAPAQQPDSADAAQAAPPPEEKPLSDGPWRADRAMGLPSWLELRFEQRTRYETLSDEFRVLPFADELVALRTRIAATVHMDNFRIGGEFQDSRAYGAPDDRLLTTGIVNAAELLQGYLGFRSNDLFDNGDGFDIQVGRHTMDVGSRRLVARNRFRNTTNAFTGVNATWSSGSAGLRAFYVVPVIRLPRNQQGLQDNEVEFDEEDEGTSFFGVHGGTDFGSLSTEAYALGLDESDSSNVLTRNRQFWTLGARVHTAPQPGHLDFEWESAYQFGESRATTSNLDRRDLDHSAWFHHFSLGYLFGGDIEPRIEGLFDYATGDDDPDDDENNRFDTLFGARRFEYGPTGIYGGFARSNIVSPGARFTCKPETKTQLMLAHRFYYLASDRDFWTTSGLVDPTGNSGSYLGQQAEVRVRYDVVPKNFRVEFGVAHLFAGSFIDDAPNNTGQGDTTYGYVQMAVGF